MQNRFFPRHKSRLESPPDPAFRPDWPRLSEQKIAAWALVMGVPTPLGQAPRCKRPHRGQLPDVDFTQIAPLRPSHSAVWSRIIRFLRIGRPGRNTARTPG